MFFLLFLGLIIFFIINYLIKSQPLTNIEIRQLAEIKRQKDINKYYEYSTSEYKINKDFKRKINPKGKFYNINESLYNLPAMASALLKYKKHEWIIFGFEKNKKIDLIWINKGYDNSSASSYLSSEEIINIAKEKKYNSVQMFHNHPNGAPGYYDCTGPSPADIFFSDKLSKELIKEGISHVAYVCERGTPYRYYLSYPEEHYPLQPYLDEINSLNGRSRVENYRLRAELKSSK